MFFYISKIGWLLLSPVNLVAVLLCGWILATRFQAYRLRRVLLGAAVSIFLICGLLPVGTDGLYYLESQYNRPAKFPPHVDGIIVLGGAVDTRASIVRNGPEFNDAVERVLQAVKLGRYFPKAKIVFSGGSGALIDNQRPESVDMKTFIEDMGYESLRVVYEDKSRTTSENLINSYSMAKPKKGENWILVTSAYHMPRAMAVARKLGWGLIPYPVDYRSDGRYVFMPERFDVLENLRAAQIALREMTGLAAYKITGKI